MRKKTVLITGASRGIGKEAAKLFLKNDWNIIASMRSPEKERDLISAENVLVTRLDVQDSQSISKAIEEGIKKFGQVDILINNAGYGVYGAIEAISREKLLNQFDVNVFGLIEVTKALLPHFKSNGGGLVINISSLGGRMSLPLGSLYHGSKFAIEGISEAMVYELNEINCQVKLIEPGLVDTDFGGIKFDLVKDSSLVEYKKLYDGIDFVFTKLIKEATKPIEVANVIYQAATDGTDQFRYVVGDDAIDILEKKSSLTDQSFISHIKSLFCME